MRAIGRRAVLVFSVAEQFAFCQWLVEACQAGGAKGCGELNSPVAHPGFRCVVQGKASILPPQFVSISLLDRP
jgi:hypothetical protein